MRGPNPDRLFPPDPGLRRVARALFDGISDLPLVSVHGHVEASLLLHDQPFPDPAALLVTPDHYVTRLLHASGIGLGELGVGAARGAADTDPRRVWRLLCEHWDDFLGTASRLWLEHTLWELFGVAGLGPSTADESYEQIAGHLVRPEFRPRALYQRFNLEVLATTDSAVADLEGHRALRADRTFEGVVVPTFRPDSVVDPETDGWAANLEHLGAVAGHDTGSYRGYLQALQARRAEFIAAGALASDHGPPSALTRRLEPAAAARLFDRLRTGRAEAGSAEVFRAHMLVEMAAMSMEDGLVMQLHPGVLRDHDRANARRFGPDIGGDFPVRQDFTTGLRDLLERHGSSDRFTLVVYTADETAFSRELAPMASYYRSLHLGAPWWFLDAPDAMSRFFSTVPESAGWTKLSGFVDDTRAFCSIPARHDMARRACCAHLARLVGEHRISEDDAIRLAAEFAYHRPRATYGVANDVAKD